MTTTSKPARRGRPFQKGHDPRRHKFTREECVRGFWAAIDSVIIRHPEASKNGRHMACNLLPALIAKKEGKR